MSIEIIAEVKEPRLEESPRFPFPMRYKANGMIVLFFEETKGTVVCAGEGNKPTLYCETNYISCFDSEHWETVEAGTEYSIKLTFKGYDR